MGDSRISSFTGAGITRIRAAVHRAGLIWGVVDRVAWRGATSLEGMVQSDPMANGDLVISSQRQCQKITTYPASWVRVLPKLKGAPLPPGTLEERITTPSLWGLFSYDDGKVAYPKRSPWELAMEPTL